MSLIAIWTRLEVMSSVMVPMSLRLLFLFKCSYSSHSPSWSSVVGFIIRQQAPCESTLIAS
uniref:Uncharacterized protein n=1 Tax=Anguilla anguilla TaxID=7936 RepID=A0A0E9TD50_ANGAN